MHAMLTLEDKLSVVSDASGKPTAVMVPIDVWRQIESELETQYVLNDSVLIQRIRAARDANDFTPLEQVREQLRLGDQP